MTAIILLTLLALIFGLILGYVSIRYKVEGDPLVEKINGILPQTQCGQCSYAGCRPYASAIAKGEADINQCPPGGETTIIALADLLGKEIKPLNPENGVEQVKRVALIDEQNCIGCTLCIQACPVDAILGCAKLMHTVIADECTGCDLCLPPCPVDCIAMIPVEITTENWRVDFPQGLPENLAELSTTSLSLQGNSSPRTSQYAAEDSSNSTSAASDKTA